ncbi:Uncharacterized protein Fot_55738 [Forsythia ovata]|uniref:Uncharacterized protein n=1 Tax=Forsythia ovata TaxID=205694 RepID=A0ABD1P544_9LAMI
MGGFVILGLDLSPTYPTHPLILLTYNVNVEKSYVNHTANDARANTIHTELYRVVCIPNVKGLLELKKIMKHNFLKQLENFLMISVGTKRQLLCDLTDFHFDSSMKKSSKLKE